MPTLYVTTEGARISKSSRRLTVSTDSTAQSVRLREVDRIVLTGRVEVTASALRAILENRIETTFLTRNSRLLGTLAPPGGKNVFLRVAQVQRHADLQFRLRFGRAVVAAKILNGRRVLQLFVRRRERIELSPTLASLIEAARHVVRAEGIAQLMGTEGEAAATYFRGFGSLFLGPWRFEARSRRPPRDPVNSLLSLGYTLLTGEAVGALAAEGLDPDVGFLHELSYGRPSLALDLIEAFRHAVVDRLTLSLTNRKVVKAEDFERDNEGAVLLKDGPRRRFFDFYDRTMTSPFASRDGEAVTYRKLLRAHARDVARCVLSNENYKAYRLG